MLCNTNFYAGLETETAVGFSQKNQKIARFSKEKLKESFSPEFLNRFDAIVEFNPLSPDSISQIFDIKFSKISDRLLENLNIKIQLTATAKKYLIEMSYEPENGARPIERTLNNKVLNVVSDAFIQNSENKNMILDLSDDDTLVVVSPEENK